MLPRQHQTKIANTKKPQKLMPAVWFILPTFFSFSPWPMSYVPHSFGNQHFKTCSRGWFGVYIPINLYIQYCYIYRYISSNWPNTNDYTTRRFIAWIKLINTSETYIYISVHDFLPATVADSRNQRTQPCHDCLASHEYHPVATWLRLAAWHRMRFECT